MAIHSDRVDHLKRRRESLGHVKLSLSNLSELVDEWESFCDSVTISVGDGMTADFVEDLEFVTKSERSHLAIQTENPTATILLRRYKAELSYIQHPEEFEAINNIRLSLRQYKIRLPFYRMRTFWWWIYITLGTLLVLVIRGINNWNDPLWPFTLPFIGIAILTFWLVYSLQVMSKKSSTRLVNNSSRTLFGKFRKIN